MYSQNKSDTRTVSEIIEKDILDLIGGGNLSQEKKDELHSKMLKTIQNRVIARVDSILSDEEIKEWQKLVEVGDLIKIKNFFDSKGIDIEEQLVEEAIVYKTDVVTYFDYINKTGAGLDGLEKKVSQMQSTNPN